MYKSSKNYEELRGAIEKEGTVKILAHFPTAPRPAVRCGYSSSSVTSR